jgi:glutamate dehydrogenase
VNIKILLDAGIRRHEFTHAERNGLLAEMTDSVAEHVLANNTAHNRLLSDARFNAAQMVHVHARITAALERRHGLHRERDVLPTAEAYLRLANEGSGLAGPELAVLMAHIKLDLKADLLGQDDFDDPHFGATGGHHHQQCRPRRGRDRQCLPTRGGRQVLTHLAGPDRGRRHLKFLRP